MISKELLSEVLGYVPYKILPISNVSGVGTKTFIFENEDGTVKAYWNIYELANLCKKWAFNNKVSISTRKTLHNGWNASIQNKMIVADTEPGATFKICEYILKQKDKR